MLPYKAATTRGSGGRCPASSPAAQVLVTRIVGYRHGIGLIGKTGVENADNAQRTQDRLHMYIHDCMSHVLYGTWHFSFLLFNVGCMQIRWEIRKKPS